MKHVKTKFHIYKKDRRFFMKIEGSRRPIESTFKVSANLGSQQTRESTCKDGGRSEGRPPTGRDVVLDSIVLVPVSSCSRAVRRRL